MLATLSDTKTYLWVTWTDQDALLTLLLEGASAKINSYVGRTLEASDYTEYKDGNWQLSFVLDNYPVNTITSVELNTWDFETATREAVSGTNYHIDTENGEVNFLERLNRGFGNYKVTYNGWYETIPSDIQMACMDLVGYKLNTRSSGWIKSESVAGDSISYWLEMWESTILSSLNHYRDVNF